MGNIIGRVFQCKQLSPCNSMQSRCKQDLVDPAFNTLVVPSGISEDTIRKIVDGFMKNKKINQRYIPDAIERQIYQNVIVLLMALLEESLKTARIQFLGHELTVHIGAPPGEVPETIVDVTSTV